MFSIFYKEKDSQDLSLIDNFKSGAWVSLTEPDEKEIDRAVAMLKVEKSLLTDSLDEYEMPRLEIEDDAMYIYVRVPEKTNGDIITFPLLIVVGENFVLTVSSRKTNLFNKFISGRAKSQPAEKTEFILKIFLALNEKYHFFMIDINRRLRSIKLRLKKIGVQDIIQFVDFEQVLNDFLSSLVPLDSVFKKILSGRHIALKEEEKDLAEDVVLGNIQLIELSKSYLRYAVNIKDTHSNIATHELNRVIKVLTVMTILMTLPNMVFSFFGMNVPLVFASNQYSFVIILFATFSFIGLISWFIIKKRWL